MFHSVSLLVFSWGQSWLRTIGDCPMARRVMRLLSYFLIGGQNSAFASIPFETCQCEHFWPWFERYYLQFCTEYHFGLLLFQNTPTFCYFIFCVFQISAVWRCNSWSTVLIKSRKNIWIHLSFGHLPFPLCLIQYARVLGTRLENKMS